MKRLLSILLALTFVSPQFARAQLLSRVGAGIGYYWGEAKTGVIKANVDAWDEVAGNSCGDVTPKTARALQSPPSCSAKTSGVDDFVEAAFFNAGAKIEINDERCQIARYKNYSTNSKASQAALHAFGRDLRTKLPDLRQLYQEIQTLTDQLGNQDAILAKGAGPNDLQKEITIRKTLSAKQSKFNTLLFSSPIAHFPEGQELLQKVVAKGQPLTDEMIRSSYAQASNDIQKDMDHLKSRQTSPGTFDLSRTDKVFLMKQGNPASWFKHDAQSAADAKKLMCNMDRVYGYGETVANNVLGYGSYVFGLEGYLIKVSFAAKFAAMAARARKGLVSLETMNMLSWGAWSASAVDGAIKTCSLPVMHVGRSDQQCNIDPKNEVVTMERQNCALGLAMAGGALVFTAGTTALGQKALKAAKAEIVEHVPEEVMTPMKRMKARVDASIADAMAPHPSLKTPLKIEQEFPALGTSIDRARKTLAAGKIETRTRLEAKRLSATLVQVEDLAIRSALESSVTKMSKPQEWASYTKDLMTDAAKLMKASGRAKSMTALKDGQIERWAMLKVLAQRAEARGETFQAALKTNLTEDEFFKRLENGPFLDVGFASKDGLPGSHGMDTHLLQRDFISKEVTADLPGRTNDLYKYLGQTPRGREIWNSMFDNDLLTDSPVSPEGLFKYLSPVLPIK